MRSVTRYLPLLLAFSFLFLSCTEKGDKGDTGLMGPQGVKGDPGLIWRGDWSSTTPYQVDDAVGYQGSSYVCKVAVTAAPPTNTAFWDLLADEGGQGPPGDPFTGGDVTGPTTFTPSAPATFQALVDFQQGAIVTGNGKIEWNDTPTSNDNRLEIRVDSGVASIRTAPTSDSNLHTFELDGGLSPDIDLEAVSGANINLGTSASGSASLNIGNDLIGTSVEIDAEQAADGGFGRIRIRDAAGTVTIELDGQTGNIYYTGSLIQR